MAKPRVWDGRWGGYLPALSLLVGMVASGVLGAEEKQNPLGLASFVSGVGDGTGTSTISVEQMIAALSQGDNAGVLELGLHWPPIPALPSTQEVPWWDAAQHVVEQTQQMVLLPLSSGYDMSLADAESPLLQAHRHARASRAAGEAPLLVPLSVIAEAVSFAKAADPSRSAPLLGFAHCGPWRLEAWGNDLVHRHHLTGEERWLSLNLRLLGEPRWAAAEGLRANVVWERALSDRGLPRGLSAYTPEPGTDPRYSGSPRDSGAGRRSSNRQQQDSEPGPSLTITELERADKHLRLSGQLFIEELRAHQREQAWSLDVWHQLDLIVPSGGTLWMAILSDNARTGDLAAERDLPTSQLRSPGLILVHSSEDSAAPPPPWPEVEPLDREWAAQQQRMRSARDGIPYRSDGTHVRWFPLHHGHLQGVGNEGARLRLSWYEVIGEASFPVELVMEIPWAAH